MDLETRLTQTWTQVELGVTDSLSKGGLETQLDTVRMSLKTLLWTLQPHPIHQPTLHRIWPKIDP